MSATTFEMTGTLHADGRLVLDECPALRPGRVRVALQSLAATPARVERLPDPPMLDDCIPAPFDLPYEGPVTKVAVRFGRERLPEVPFETEGAVP